MKIIINQFDNKIKLIREVSKKQEAFSFEMDVPYQLNTYKAKAKAIQELLTKEEAKELKKDKVNSLLLSDNVVGFGLFELPNLAKNKTKDVFETRFRLNFPNFNDYFFDSIELSKDQKKVFYFYKFAKRDNVNKLLNLFKTNGVNINSVNTFSSFFVSEDKDANAYPIATLVIGEYDSELIITKGNTVFSVNIFGYGKKVLLNNKEYLNSGYNFNNVEALSFSGFMKNHFLSNEPIEDENILNVKPEDGLSYTSPKELRLLKEGILDQYIVKNNFRKFYARVTEIIDFYSKEPWFFPLKEINVIGGEEVLNYLTEASKEEKIYHFVDLAISFDTLFEKEIKDCALFKKKGKVKGERRKIDWKAFLNMEIGKKKKA